MGRSVREMFNALSPTYDRVNRVLSLGLDLRWRKKLARHLPARPHLEILDLATGTGDQIFSLFDASASIRSATGIDLAVQMLDLAKKKGEKKSYRDRLSFLEADAQKLPFRDGHFDAATFAFGIRNVNSPLEALREIHRTLKPLGRCLVLEFSLPPIPIRWGYLFYLRHILPKVGGALSKDFDAYRYLNQTIEKFPHGKAFCALMQEAGFTQVKAHKMALGAVTLYVGEKGLLEK